MSLTSFALIASNELIRFITGQLFTEKQIRSITSHAVGKYLLDWFPDPEEERKARERVEEAKQHITEASAIITAMQVELINQSAELDNLLKDIEEKRRLAERYTSLAQTTREKFSAFRAEMEESLREELRRQSEQGKTARQIISISFWFITLFLGAALGTYFKEIIAWVLRLLG